MMVQKLNKTEYIQYKKRQTIYLFTAYGKCGRSQQNWGLSKTEISETEVSPKWVLYKSEISVNWILSKTDISAN